MHALFHTFLFCLFYVSPAWKIPVGKSTSPQKQTEAVSVCRTADFGILEPEALLNCGLCIFSCLWVDFQRYRHHQLIKSLQPGPIRRKDKECVSFAMLVLGIISAIRYIFQRAKQLHMANTVHVPLLKQNKQPSPEKGIWDDAQCTHTRLWYEETSFIWFAVTEACLPLLTDTVFHLWTMYSLCSIHSFYIEPWCARTAPVPLITKIAKIACAQLHENASTSLSLEHNIHTYTYIF